MTRHPSSRRSLPVLETPCDQCGGSGEAGPAYTDFIEGREIPQRCRKCLGRGQQLTPDGEILLDFYDRWNSWA